MDGGSRASNPPFSFIVKRLLAKFSPLYFVWYLEASLLLQSMTNWHNGKTPMTRKKWKAWKVEEYLVGIILFHFFLLIWSCLCLHVLRWFLPKYCLYTKLEKKGWGLLLLSWPWPWLRCTEKNWWATPPWELSLKSSFSFTFPSIWKSGMKYTWMP